MTPEMRKKGNPYWFPNEVSQKPLKEFSDECLAFFERLEFQPILVALQLPVVALRETSCHGRHPAT